MKICTAKHNLVTAINILFKLKINGKDETLKKEITELLDSFTPNAIDQLKTQLLVRKKQRERQAKARLKYRALKKEKEILKKQREKEVDAWFQQCQEAEARIKAEESVRRQADVVLHGVKRRIADARRILSILPALSKLREGRCLQDAGSGGQPSAAVAGTFDKALGHLKGLWERQLEGYLLEETGLKVMLDEGSASRLGRVERELDNNLHDWSVALFGKGDIPEITWHQLSEVRTAWDQFLVPPSSLLASNIPTGWLLPQPVADSEWKDAVIWD